MSKFPPLKAVHRYSITLFLKAQEKNDAISALLDRVNKIEPEEVLSEISSIFGRPMEAEFQAWLENDLSARQYQLELQRRALRDERRRLHEYASAGLSLRLNLLHNAEYWCTKSEAKRGSGSVLILRHENSIFVADTGPGIPEDVSEQIFELGFSKAEEGVIHSYSKGLGLFLVKMSMEREGYKVILHQSPPPFIPPLYSGACFELNFAKETA